MAIKKTSNCLLCGSEYEVCKLCQNVIRRNRLNSTAEDIKGFVPSVQATLKPLYAEPAKQEKAEKTQSAAKADNKKSL